MIPDASGMPWREVAQRLDVDLAAQIRRNKEMEREVAEVKAKDQP